MPSGIAATQRQLPAKLLTGDVAAARMHKPPAVALGNGPLRTARFWRDESRRNGTRERTAAGR